MTTVNSGYMAEFTSDSAEFRVIAETNSVTYHLEIYASHSNSSPNTGAVIVNGTTLATPTSGINVYELLSDGTIGTVKNFTITPGTDTSGNNAFVQYMQSLGTGVRIIVSSTQLYTSPVIDTWFSGVYSKAWQGAQFIDQFPNSAYCAIYGCYNKKIMQEAFYGNDGVLVEDSRAYLGTVFDVLADLGSTGFPSRIIEDTTEYSYTKYDTMRYPNSTTTSVTLSDYGVSAGKIVLISADMYTSTALNTAGANTRLSVRALNSTGGLVDSFSIDCTTLDAWTKFQKYYTIPSGCTAVSAVVSPYPAISTSVTDVKWGVRNFTVSQTSETDKGTSISEFGVNGVRMFSSNEGATSYLMELEDSNSVDKEKVPFITLKELPR